MADTSNNNSNTDIILDIQVRYEEAINGIARYRSQIDEVKKANADLKKQLKEGTISQEDYNKAVAANNEIIWQCNEATRALRREIQNNIRTEKNQEGSIKRLQAEIANLNRKYEAMGKAERETAEGQELLNHINELQDELNSANEARQRFHQNVGTYENAIRNTLGINNEFASSLMQLATSSQTGQRSLSTFFTNAGTSAKAFGKALLGLLANPVFLAIAGIAGVGVVFKFWFDYNKGLIEATRLTKQFTGLSGNELKAFRNEVQAVSDTFGKDFKEVLEASNTVAKQFGITQQEALQHIKDGFIAGADASGDFLDITKEYPTFFNEAGISASQFMAIVSQTQKEGVFSDKGIDAIKEANIRIREMTDSTADALDGIGISSQEVQKQLRDGTTTTFEVMQKVSQKLNELPSQSKEVGTAIADIFGGAGEDAGLKYLRTIKDIETNLDVVKGKSGELGKIQEEQMNANIELQNTISALFDQTGGTFENLIGKSKIFATQSLTSIIKGLIGVANWFIDIYNKSMLVRAGINLSINSFKALFELTKAGFSALSNQIKNSADLLGVLFTGEFEETFNRIEKRNKQTSESFSKAWERAKNITKESINEIENGKIKPIEIPVNVVSESEGTETLTKGGKSDLTEDAKQYADKQKQIRDQELQAIRTFEDSVTALMTDEAEKQRRQIEISYTRQIEDLNKRLNEEKTLTKDARDAINNTILNLEKQKQNELDKLNQDELKKQVEIQKQNLANRLASIKEDSSEALKLRIQSLELQRDEEIKNAEKTGLDISLIRAKYQKQIDDENLKASQDANNKLINEQKMYWQNKIAEAQLNNQQTFDLQIQAKQQELASLKQLQDESDAEFLNRQLTLLSDIKNLNEQKAAHELQTQQQILSAYETMFGALSGFMNEFAENSSALGAFAKMLAAFEIGLNTAKALSAGIAAAQSVPFPGNLVAIATTVGTILTNIAKAKEMLTSSKEPKTPRFNQGGLVVGKGSGTSDSIRAFLSNGESVMTAKTTSMFSPILSAFNQIGGGVPISTQDTSNQVMGEEMLSRAFAKAVLMLPNPVVSVREIDNVNNRIDVLESSRSL